MARLHNDISEINMGNRYFGIQLKCPYCGYMNKGLPYSESSNWTFFDCAKCKKTSKIEMIIDFKAKKVW